MFVIFFQVAFDERGVDRSGTDTIKANFRGVIDSQLAGHGDDGPFCGAVGEPFLHTDQARDGPDVYNRAFGCPQKWHREFGDQVETPNVHTVETVEVFGFGFLDAAHHADSRVVDQDVKTVECGECGFYGCGIGNIEYAECGSRQFSGEGFGFGAVNVDDNYFGTGLGHGSTGVFPNATGAAGDEGFASVESERLIHRVNCNRRVLAELNTEIVNCQRCPRLLQYGAEVAEVKRRAYRDWRYWGKPVPSFGDPCARLLILGLAPGAHGAHRTGRMFTGDSSGEYLYRAMHRAGFASQPTGTAIDDGLELSDAWITAAAHCAPPDNKPQPGEIRNCRPYFQRELSLLSNVKVVLVLGKIAFDSYLAGLREDGRIERLADFRFGHNMAYPMQPSLLCSYHPSQQNTSTGKLTASMLDDVFRHAGELIKA